MRATLSRALLTISIDLHDDVATVGLAIRRSAEAIADRLLEMLARHQIAATFGLRDPTTSPTTQRIVTRRAGHEIAWLGDASWVGHTTGRSCFARELARRAAAARAQGLCVSTLLVADDDLDEHCDLVVKHGITAVRHAPRPGGGRPRASVQPGTLRFGLWSFPVSCALPGNSRWLPGGGGGRVARSTVDRAIVHHRLVQLAVDASRLAACGYAAQRVLDAVLAHAEWRRRQGVLDIATIGAAAARLSSQHQSIPSRSILRPAA